MISVITKPNIYQPAYNNLVVQLTSTEMSNFKYRFVVNLFFNNTQVGTFKITPQNPQWGQIDLGIILKNYVNTEIVNIGCNDNEPISKAKWGALMNDIGAYQAIIGEEYALTADSDVIQFNGLGEVGPPSFTYNIFPEYTYNGVKEWMDGKQFNISPYFLSGQDPDERLFLTNAPRTQYIGPDEWQTLSAINLTTSPDFTGSTPVFSAIFEFYDDNNDFISSARTYNLVDNCGWRPDCSTETDQLPVSTDYFRYYISYLGVGTNNLIEHNITLPPNARWYRVALEGADETITPGGIPPEFTLFVARNLCNNQLIHFRNIAGLNQGVVGQYFCLNNEPYLIEQFDGGGFIIINVDTFYSTLQQVLNVCECAAPPPPPNGIGGLNGPEGNGPEGGNEDPCLDSVRISEYFYFYLKEKCGVGKRRIAFINKFGTIDYYTFRGREDIGYDVNREDYTEAPILYTTGFDSNDYFGYNYTNKTWNNNQSKTGVIRSGFIPKSDLLFLVEELLRSPRAWIVYDDGLMYPIVLTNTEVVEPNLQVHNLYELVIEFKGGYKEIRQNN